MYVHTLYVHYALIKKLMIDEADIWFCIILTRISLLAAISVLRLKIFKNN